MRRRLLILSLFVVFGCVPAQKDESFLKAESLFMQEDFVSAEKAFMDYIRQHPRSRLSCSAWLYAGRCRLALREYDEAKQAFQQALSLARGRRARAQVKMAFADLYYQRSQFENASRTYKKLWLNDVDYLDGAQLLYALGVATQRIGKWREGRSYLELLIKKFPDSHQATLARQRLTDEKDEFFSVQVGAFVEEPLARKLSAELQAKKFEPFIRVVERSGRKFYRVRVGKLPSWREAEALRQKLLSAGYPDSFPVP